MPLRALAPAVKFSLPSFSDIKGSGWKQHDIPAKGASKVGKGPHAPMVISNPNLGIHFAVQYNPARIKNSKGSGWKQHDIPGMVQPLLTYGCGEMRRKTFELFLDAHASPHPNGHIAEELELLRYLQIPFGTDNHPTVQAPKYAKGNKLRSGLGQAGGAQLGLIPGRPDVRLAKTNQLSRDIGGVPPFVKISYGGLVEKGCVLSCEEEIEFFGTTPQAASGQLPTRATVMVEFLISEDWGRMTVTYERHGPE